MTTTSPEVFPLVRVVQFPCSTGISFASPKTMAVLDQVFGQKYQARRCLGAFFTNMNPMRLGRVGFTFGILFPPDLLAILCFCWADLRAIHFTMSQHRSYFGHNSSTSNELRQRHVADELSVQTSLQSDTRKQLRPHPSPLGSE